MIELRQSTAGQEVPLGYFLDSTDGDSEEISLTIASTDIKLWKWGATTLADKNSGGGIHISNGVYYAVLDATDSNTLGPMVIFVHVSGALTVRLECAVLPANVWDSKYSTDKLEVDIVQVLGTATPTPTVAGRLVVSAGYGDAVWVDTVGGAAGTVSHVNGTLENPSNSIANAKVIADVLNIKTFRVLPGSSVTLAANYDNYIFDACHATVILNGQSVNNAVFIGCIISGNDDGSNASHTQYFDCFFSSSALGQFVFTRCYISGTITLAQTGTYFMHQSFSANAGLATIVLDFGAALAVSDVSMRDFQGGVHVHNMGNTGADKLTFEGRGQLILNTNCNPANSPVIAVRGAISPLTDNVAGGFEAGGGTISGNARYDVAQVQAGAQAALEVNNIDHLMKTPVVDNADMTVEVADGTVISNMISKTSDTSSYVVGDDSQEAIRDAIVDANPQNHSATANTETTGTLDSGTFADTVTDNGVYYQTSPVTPAVGGFGLNVKLTFSIGTGRVATSILINGRFTAGAQRTVQIWAYDYDAAVFVQLSNAGTDFGHSGTDSTQQYALTNNMRQLSDGEVEIRATSESTTVGDDWYWDLATVSSVAQEAAGLTAEVIAQAVWEHLNSGHDEGTMGHNQELMFVQHADIAAVTDATTFTIDAGSNQDTAYEGSICVVQDLTDDHFEARRIITYTGATKTIVLEKALTFTPAIADHVNIMGTGYADVNVTHVAGTLQTALDINDIKTKTDLLPESPQKNTALNDLTFLMVDATDHATPEIGLTVTGQVSKDGAAFGAVAGVIAEIGVGAYKINATAADMNADILMFRFSAAGAADTFITIITSS